MKDALRYLESGELGKLAFKPKDNANNDVELEDDNSAAPGEAKKQKSEVSSTREQIICHQSSKCNQMVKDEEILKSACTEKCVSHSVQTSDQSGKMDTDLSSSNLPEAKLLMQIEGRNDSGERVSLCPTIGVNPANQSLESEETMQEKKKTQLDKRKSKRKKEYHLPRRASKRLAGLDIDPTPELKTSRARRVDKKPAETGASTPPSSSPGTSAHWASWQPAQLEAGLEGEIKFDSSKDTKVLVKSINIKHTSADLTNGVEHAGSIQEENKNVRKPKSSAALPGGNMAFPEENPGRVGKENVENEKTNIPIDLPSMDLWSDPCIQFAIKTLTGEEVTDSPKSMVVSPVSNSSQHATGDLATHKKMEETGNKGDKKQGRSVVLPLQDLGIPEEHPRKVEDNCRDCEKSGSLLNVDNGSWMDPCIEFAIKTLTGAIPVDCVLDIRDTFHSQQSTSHTQASSGLTSSKAGLNSFCQTDFLCKQFDTLEKPSYRQQTGKASSQSSATVLHHVSEGRGDRCQ